MAKKKVVKRKPTVRQAIPLEEQITATKGSIAKWRRIYDYLRLENIYSKIPATLLNMERGPHNCPLCQMTVRDLPDGEYRLPSCNKCPVFVQTRQIGCYGTPYVMFTRESAGLEKGTAPTNVVLLMWLALAERAFLEDVLQGLEKRLARRKGRKQ